MGLIPNQAIFRIFTEMYYFGHEKNSLKVFFKLSRVTIEHEGIKSCLGYFNSFSIEMYNFPMHYGNRPREKLL